MPVRLTPGNSASWDSMKVEVGSDMGPFPEDRMRKERKTERGE